MLCKKLGFVFRPTFTKHLSTVALPKTVNELPEENNSITFREKEILKHPDYFNVHSLFTVKDLFNAKVHYGHKVTSLNNNMRPFVFGSRLGHVIFDLDITAYFLREALNFTAHLAYRDGIILFVSKNPRMTLIVEKTALECKEYAVTREWRLGVFTDSEKKFGTSVRLPELCILLNTLEENGLQHQCVVEAAKLCIPTIGIVDSNCQPNLITYPVPGNDDSLSCFELYCNLFKEAILRGKNERKKDEEKIKKMNEKNEMEEKKSTEKDKSDAIVTEGTNNKIITSDSNDIKNNEVDKHIQNSTESIKK